LSDQLNFRWAQAGDFDAVLGLASQLAVHIEAAPPPLTRRRFETWYVGDDAPMRLLLARRGTSVLGMIAWTLTHELYSAEARVYISDLAVDRTARGQGIGASMMALVMAWARSRGASKLGWEIWHKNLTAKTFYESLGASMDEETLPYGLALDDA
jgi:GNAT superfamily N-acetyltransferase